METGSEVADGQSVTRRRGCSVQTGLSFLSASKASEKVKVKSLSCVRLFATPRTVACHGIVQARVLEWIAISFSRGSLQADALPSEPPRQVQTRDINLIVTKIWLLFKVMLLDL